MRKVIRFSSVTEFITLIVVSLLAACYYAQCSQIVLCVHSSTDQNVSSTQVTCHEWHRFQSAIHILQGQNETTIAIFSQTIRVDAPVFVSYKNNISLKGIGIRNTKIVCTEHNIGFVFEQVTNLQISNIDFVECTNNFYNKTISDLIVVMAAAVTVLDSINVTVREITVSKSLGIGIIFKQTRGNIEIYDSVFEHNGWGMNHSNTRLSNRINGGGLYIEIEHSQEIYTTYYDIFNCEFYENNSTTSHLNSDDERYWGAKSYDFTQGGGITLYLEDNKIETLVLINNSRIHHNQADWGGGMIIVMLNDYSEHAEKSKLIVQNSVISDNTCRRHGGGVGFYFSEGMQYETPIAKFINCTIESNSAGIYGGGTRVVTAKSSMDTPQNRTKTINKSDGIIIIFKECVWSKNSALFGSAIDIFSQDLDRKYPWSIMFSDCIITRNSIVNSLTDSETVNQKLYSHHNSGKGALACAQFVLRFSGMTSVESNNGSAIYLSSCHIVFENKSIVQLANNSGYHGGAIVLIGQSALLAGVSSAFYFVNNSATWRGGAIMYFSTSEQEILSSKSCFLEFRYSKNSYNGSKHFPSFYFVDNKAQYGQAIFASTIQQCQRYCNKKTNYSMTSSSIDSPLSCIGYFNFSELNPIATSGNNITSESSQMKLFARPGWEITLDLEFKDWYSQQSYDVFHVSVQNHQQSNVSINPAYSYVAEKKTLKFRGKPGDNATVSLVTTEFQPITTSIAFEVMMTSCPPGFVINKDLECACSILSESNNLDYVGIHRCNRKSGKAYILHQKTD